VIAIGRSIECIAAEAKSRTRRNAGGDARRCRGRGRRFVWRRPASADLQHAGTAVTIFSPSSV